MVKSLYFFTCNLSKLSNYFSIVFPQNVPMQHFRTLAGRIRGKNNNKNSGQLDVKWYPWWDSQIFVDAVWSVVLSVRYNYFFFYIKIQNPDTISSRIARNMYVLSQPDIAINWSKMRCKMYEGFMQTNHTFIHLGHYVRRSINMWLNCGNRWKVFQSTTINISSLRFLKHQYH
jgi:hypothetical protein